MSGPHASLSKRAILRADAKKVDGATRSLASLRRAYTSATGTTLAPSAFYARFTPSLKTLMQKLTERALVKLAHDGTKRRRAFGVFMKLLIADGSLVRLCARCGHDSSVATTGELVGPAPLSFMRPLAVAVASKKIRKRGQKRGTTYHVS